MSQEIWKDVVGYEGYYSISNKGRLRSNRHNKIMVPQCDGAGYLKVTLCVNGKVKSKRIARMVAEAFIPNPDNLPYVNHKDSNIQNNTVDNLEWCDAQYNSLYSHGYPVVCYNNGRFVAKYESLTMAAEALGVSRDTIKRAVTTGTKVNGLELVKLDMSLAMMYSMQEKMQKRLGLLEFNNELERTTYIKNQAQYVDQELHEMLRELRYFKEWKTYDWDDDEVASRWEAARREFIDAFHFIMNIGLALEMDTHDIYEEYLKKNVENHIRQDEGY
jgi:hypothetical protein